MKSLVIIIPIPPGKGYVFSNGKERIIYPKDYFLRLLELTKDTVWEYQNDVEISIVTSNYNGITIESINQITTCELAIAFATARISNTFWQIGLRHGTKKPTIIFQDEKDDSKLGIIGGLMSYSYSIESKKDENKFKERLIDKLNIYELSRPDLMDKNGFENLNLGLNPIYLNLLDLISRNKINDCLRNLNTFILSINGYQYMKEFSLISYRWKNFEEKERLNLVQLAELEVEKNKIVNSLIEFISLIQNEKMNSMSDNG